LDDRNDPVAFLREDRAQDGGDPGDVHAPEGVEIDAGTGAQVGVANGQVRRAALLTDDGSDAFLGVWGNAVPVRLAV
jgi:hypothetical protein